MTFAEVYESASIGATLTVSNGEPAPSVQTGFRYSCWRSHNFSGELLEKRGGAPRAMIIADADPPCRHRVYTIVEGMGHSIVIEA